MVIPPMRLSLAPMWQDHARRFAPLKLATLLLLSLPAVQLALRWATHDLGARPIVESIHVAGDWAVRFTVLALAVSAARAVLDWPRILLVRRMIGVTAACYASLHLLLYCLDQKWNLLTVVREIFSRFYLTIGFAALLGLLVLAVTSTDGWQKTLGRNWKRIHQAVFPIALLAVFHYFLQSKADVTDAVFLFGLLAWLLLWRLVPRRFQSRLALLPVLAISAALLTAGAEAAWYGLATGVDARRVLAGNLDIAFGLRPAVEVLACGLLLAAMAGVRRLFRRRSKALPAAARRA